VNRRVRHGVEASRLSLPCERLFVTSQGSSGRFQRACDREQVEQAEMAAREMGWLSLIHALSLVVVYARAGSPKFEPAAVRWLARLAPEGREVDSTRSSSPPAPSPAFAAGNTSKLRRRYCACSESRSGAAIRARWRSIGEVLANFATHPGGVRCTRKERL
jgi:hypothetical protein